MDRMPRCSNPVTVRAQERRSSQEQVVPSSADSHDLLPTVTTPFQRREGIEAPLLLNLVRPLLVLLFVAGPGSGPA